MCCIHREDYGIAYGYSPLLVAHPDTLTSDPATVKVRLHTRPSDWLSHCCYGVQPLLRSHGAWESTVVQHDGTDAAAGFILFAWHMPTFGPTGCEPASLLPCCCQWLVDWSIPHRPSCPPQPGGLSGRLLTLRRPLSCWWAVWPGSMRATRCPHPWTSTWSRGLRWVTNTVKRCSMAMDMPMV
jgi:hypothetical protein